MKNKALFAFIFFIAISRFGYSQITVIPDPNFEQALIDLGYDDVIDGQAQTATLASIGTLDVSNKGINDLTGIESFYILFSLDVKDNSLTTLNLVNNVGLNFLDCRNNTLTELDLSQNLFITDLNCSLNELTSLSLAGNTVIETLNCSNNQLTTLDISDAGLLIDLNCSVNELSSLDITNSFGIEKINCSGNNLETYNFSNNTNLRNLSIQFNPTTELDVTNNTLLNTLYCNNNWALLGSINLENNALLTTFSSSNTSLDCIQVANANDALDGVGIYATWSKDIATLYSTDCAGIEKTLIPDSNFEQVLIDEGYDNVLNGEALTHILSEVGILNIQNKNISDLIGIEDFEALQYLYAQNNNLTTIDVSNNLNLRFLYCNGNQLNDLDVTNNIDLFRFSCSDNLITELDVSQNLNLLDFQCDRNQLTSLDISNNSDLEYLRCHLNAIDSLDTSNNPVLSLLLANSNQLTSIDVTQNTELVSLNINNNPVLSGSVDLTNNPNLVTMIATNTSLGCIQVTDEVEANDGQGIYADWFKASGTVYSENCATTLSVDNFNIEDAIEVYPNPVSDTLHIKINQEQSQSNITHTVLINAIGQKVFETKGYVNTIDVQNFENGIYFLQIQTDLAQPVTKKLVIQ